MEQRELRFNADSEYWCVSEGKQNLYDLCNGDRLWIQVGESYYSTRIDWDEEWFVRLGKKKFWLHRKTRYQILVTY
jgi:hypothetical protein